MAKGFGNLYYIRNIVYYKVSSYEQKAFGNQFWKTTLKNAYNEIREHAPVMVPPFAIAYLYVQWGIKERERMIRKDPSLYKDDEE